MNITKLVLTEVDGNEIDVVINAGVSAAVATLDDGSQVTIFPVAPVVTPAVDTVVEVDVKTASGEEEVFVPKEA